MAYLIAFITPHMAILAAKRTLKHLADEKRGVVSMEDKTETRET